MLDLAAVAVAPPRRLQTSIASKAMNPGQPMDANDQHILTANLQQQVHALQAQVNELQRRPDARAEPRARPRGPNH